MKRLLYKYGTRPNEIRRAKKELYGRLSMVALATVFLAIMIVITRFQPRLENPPDTAVERSQIGGDVKTNAYLTALRQKADTLLKQFEEQSADSATALENIDILERAIEIQGEVIRSRTSRIAALEDVQKLEEMQTVKDQAMGEYLIAQSNREEEQARDAWRNGDVTSAISRMQRAIQIQEKVNEQYPRSSHRSSTRLHQLTNQVLVWQTQPIAEAADTLKKQAFELVNEGKFAEARRTIRLALQKQNQLMQEYRQSSYATLTRMRTFEEAFRKIDAAEDVHIIKELLNTSESSLLSGDHETALASAEEAYARQTALMEQSGIADALSTARLESIRIARDTAAGIPVFAKIEAARKATRKALANRDTDAFQLHVVDWYREGRAFLRRFPDSSQVEMIQIKEAELLYNLKTEIPVILQMVYDNLVKLPGEPAVTMYRTEVPQALYERVTGENPSSVKDPALPVDSVTWEEASAFTRKLSSVMARTVLLPDENLFRKVVGKPSVVAVRAQAWSSENSDRLTKPCGQLKANEAGFFDLLGNVSEWLAKKPTTEINRAKAIGGSARDSSARLAGIPEDVRSTGERNRYIGFRFVVDHEQDLE